LRVCAFARQVLHYQWFADFGNVDAARAVAHMLSHGAARDYEQAIRYLRQVGALIRRS
jgi:TPR repeat protein